MFEKVILSYMQVLGIQAEYTPDSREAPYFQVLIYETKKKKLNE
jgi:hypothetical protein